VVTVAENKGVQILEDIARDPDCYPTSRVKAIRTLLQLSLAASQPAVF
jgi:hypothetical protein